MSPEITALEEEPPSRGREVMLPGGGLPEVIPPYLKSLIIKTGGVNGPIGMQFVVDLESEWASHDLEKDPLNEDEHLVAPGVVYKYPGRVLFTPIFSCSAYCRFCTRGREVGVAKGLTMAQIEESLNFIEGEGSIREVIVSGGDPLVMRDRALMYILERLGGIQKRDKLDFVRVGTRLPIVNPPGIKEWHYEALKNLQIPHLMVHINHPEELTPQSIAVLTKFRMECNATVMSQSVLLRGVNDNPDVLAELFTKLAKNGIRPYYLYQNDPVPWARRFTVPVPEAIEIWQKLRPRLSGIVATARFVIDTPDGYGKIPVPEGGAWEVNYKSGYRDFQGGKHELS